MSKAFQPNLPAVVRLPKRPSRRALAYAMPRATNGRFQPVPKSNGPRGPIDWNVLYAWRDDWRAYRKLVADAKHEARFGGLRSIAIFGLMSVVMVGFLVAGVIGG